MMVNEGKSHIFYWRTKDFRFLRTFLSFGLAIIAFALVMKYAPLPFTDAARNQEEAKTQRIIASQNLAPITIISADQLASDEVNAHFSFQDPLDLSGQIQREVQHNAEALYREVLSTYDMRRREEVTYLEVPVTLPKPSEQAPSISASTPFRTIKVSPSTPPATLPHVIKATFHPSSPAIIPPLPDLKHSFSTITYHISTSKDGGVDFALPYNPSFSDPQVDGWIKKLKFPASTKNESYQVTFRAEPQLQD